MTQPSSPSVRLTQGIHVIHLFYRIDRVRWEAIGPGESANTLARVDALCGANSATSHPRLVSYANVCGKAELAFIVYAEDLVQGAQIQRDLVNCFRAGTIVRVFTYLSVTELTDYMPTDEDN